MTIAELRKLDGACVYRRRIMELISIENNVRTHRVERTSHNESNYILTLVNGEEVTMRVTDEKWVGGKKR